MILTYITLLDTWVKNGTKSLSQIRRHANSNTNNTKKYDRMLAVMSPVQNSQENFESKRDSIKSLTLENF